MRITKRRRKILIVPTLIRKPGSCRVIDKVVTRNSDYPDGSASGLLSPVEGHAVNLISTPH